jgi:hypothetical protein
MYKVQNDYTNRTLRNSFAVEILSCSEFTHSDCKSTPEIQEFLEKVYFTSYSIESYTNFGKDSDQGSALPYKTQDTFTA